jgi:NhaP-type Na+/H+ and K+/H+ antiporter
MHSEATALGKIIGALKFPNDGVTNAIIRDGQLIIPVERLC